MAAIWVLLVLTYYGGFSSQEFGSEAACREAASWIAGQTARGGYSNATATCRPKE